MFAMVISRARWLVLAGKAQLRARIGRAYLGKTVPHGRRWGTKSVVLVGGLGAPG